MEKQETIHAAGDGMNRHVLQLPKQKDESAFKVELIIGKTVQVDKKTPTSLAVISRRKR